MIMVIEENGYMTIMTFRYFVTPGEIAELGVRAPLPPHSRPN